MVACPFHFCRVRICNLPNHSINPCCLIWWSTLNTCNCNYDDEWLWATLTERHTFAFHFFFYYLFVCLFVRLFAWKLAQYSSVITFGNLKDVQKIFKILIYDEIRIKNIQEISFVIWILSKQTIIIFRSKLSFHVSS